MARAQALRGSFLMPTPSLRSSWRNLSDMTPMNGFSQGRLSRTPARGTKLRRQGLHHVHIICISFAFRAKGVPLWQLFLQESITLPFHAWSQDPQSVGWISRTLTSEISEKQKRTGKINRFWRINSFGSPPNDEMLGKFPSLGSFKGDPFKVINLTRIPESIARFFGVDGDLVQFTIPEACAQSVSNGILVASKRPPQIIPVWEPQTLYWLASGFTLLLYRPDYIMRSPDLGICLDSGERKRCKDLASDRASGDDASGAVFVDKCGNQV